MPDKAKTLDEILFDKDEANKLYEFAMTSLGCSAEQADALSRTQRHKFKWSGVRLLYHAEDGSQLVAVDHTDQVREYFARNNLDFLLPPPTHDVDGVNGGTTNIPDDVLTGAINGSVTMKGKLHNLLNPTDPNSKDALAKTELFIRASTAKKETGTLGSAIDDALARHGITRPKGSGDTNPWADRPENLDQHGRYNAKAIGLQANLCKAIGAEKAAAIASAVGSKLGDVRPPGQRRTA